jgi:hypothetical protein
MYDAPVARWPSSPSKLSPSAAEVRESGYLPVARWRDRSPPPKTSKIEGTFPPQISRPRRAAAHELQRRPSAADCLIPSGGGAAPRTTQVTPACPVCVAFSARRGRRRTPRRPRRDGFRPPACRASRACNRFAREDSPPAVGDIAGWRPNGGAPRHNPPPRHVLGHEPTRTQSVVGWRGEGRQLARRRRRGSRVVAAVGAPRGARRQPPGRPPHVRLRGVGNGGWRRRRRRPRLALGPGWRRGSRDGPMPK